MLVYQRVSILRGIGLNPSAAHSWEGLPTSDGATEQWLRMEGLWGGKKHETLVGGFNPSEKYEFVSWDYCSIPNIWYGKIKVMFQSTNQNFW
jgi:hypothetical protein